MVEYPGYVTYVRRLHTVSKPPGSSRVRRAAHHRAGRPSHSIPVGAFIGCRPVLPPFPFSLHNTHSISVPSSTMQCKAFAPFPEVARESNKSFFSLFGTMLFTMSVVGVVVQIPVFHSSPVQSRSSTSYSSRMLVHQSNKHKTPQIQCDRCSLSINRCQCRCRFQ